MSNHDPFISQLERYLDEHEGSTPLPEAVRDAIRAELPSQRQRPAWWPARRFPEMNTAVKLAMSAAAIVVIALLGIRFLAPAGVGGPEPTPTPTPTPEPRALVAGSEGPGFFTTEFVSENPGTNRVQFTFEMPADWAAVRPWVIGAGEGDSAAIAFVQPNGLHSDPCLDNQGSPDVAVGSTAAELASALAEHEAYEATATGDFTVDGYEGIRMELVMPSDLDYTTCQLDEFWVWAEPFSAGQPARWDLWILDVDGTTAVVLAEVNAATPEEQDQIEQIVASIQIQP